MKNKNSWKEIFELVDNEPFKRKIISEVNKLTVTSISEATGITLETVRRKILKLKNKKIIKSTKKGIQHDKGFQKYWEKLAFKETKLVYDFVNNISNNGGLSWLKSDEAKSKMGLSNE